MDTVNPFTNKEYGTGIMFSITREQVWGMYGSKVFVEVDNPLRGPWSNELHLLRENITDHLKDYRLTILSEMK
jgi:hypothetical protein